MISRSQEILLDALKKSLFGLNVTFPDDTVWDEVIEEAKVQAVLGIVSQVIPVSEVNSDLMEIVMADGNFGRSENSPLSYEARSVRSVVKVIKNRKFFSFYQELGLKKWSISRRYPVLKPLAFFYGFFGHIGKGIRAFIDKKIVLSQVNEYSRRERLNREIGVRTGETQQVIVHKDNKL